MSESILKALMQLFAIIAHVEHESVSKNGRIIVRSYLKTHLNKTQIEEYLKLFDEFIAFHHRDITKKDGTKIKKRTAANSVKVLMICRQINEELTQDQKVLVLIQLLEFINENDEITETEYDFVQTVANIFNISDAEYENMKAFILESVDAIPGQDKVLIIDADDTPITTEMKHIYNPSLEGEIIMLNIPSTNMYAFRYIGDDELFLNGHQIQPEQSYILDKAASIRSSKVIPIYYGNVVAKFLRASTESRIVFYAKDVEFRFKNSENGIQRFNFEEESGTLVGIMGGSGVGKSTLLNVLNGNLIPQSGTIEINGHNIHKEKDILEGVTGFVPQDDLLIEELTVWQNLYYNAKLCFRSFTEEEINQRVEKVLTELDLLSIKNLTVGGPLNKFISGGQRKRLNIALELIREPAVMFVDEPTSGLSSMDSEMVMDLLKELTLKGKLVIVNIHQPSSDIFKLFDKLLILDKGGFPIYNGNPLDAVIYFKRVSEFVNAEESECIRCGNVNPEQILQIVEAKVVDEYGKLTYERKVSPKEWSIRYTKEIEPNIELTRKTEKLPDNEFKVPGKLQQFKIFGIRNILSKLSDRQYMLINFLEAPLLAAILAYFSKYIGGTADNPNAYIFSDNENIPAYLFMSVVVALFIGLSVSAEEIIKDRKILQRESFLNLSRLSYLNSKILILFVISAIQTISFVIVGNLILDIKGMMWDYWLILFSASCCANMMGLNISAGLDSVVTIYILIPFIIVPQLLLSGTIVKFDKLHEDFASPVYVPFIGDIMTSRWAYEGLMVHQFKNNKYQVNFYDIEKQKSIAGFRNNFLIPELESKLTFIEKNIGNEEKKSEVISSFKILKNEIKNIQLEEDEILYEQLDKLNIENYDKETSKYARKYFKQLKKKYSKEYREATSAFDKKYRELLKKYQNKDAIVKLKEDYHSISVSKMVLNTTEIKKIAEIDDHLVQIAEPVYKNPESTFGRAHFYAPVKNLFGNRIDTYWFNIMAIWLMSIILYFTLVYNLVRKLITFSGKLKIKFPKKKKLTGKNE